MQLQMVCINTAPPSTQHITFTESQKMSYSIIPVLSYSRLKCAVVDEDFYYVIVFELIGKK